LYMQFFPSLEDNKVILNKKHFKRSSKIKSKLSFGHFFSWNREELSGPFFIRLGSWKKAVLIESQSDFPEYKIGVPIDFFDNITIPNNIPFQILIDGIDIYLGPVIAILVNKNILKSKKKLKRYFDYFADYYNINGLIYLFSIENVNLENKTIVGYYYQPPTNYTNGKFIKGIFPYPDVIYRRKRVNANNAQYSALLEHLDGNIFNGSDFNKYQMWQALFSNPHLQIHLPETKLLRTVQDLNDLLYSYRTVYLKPVNGSFGRGLFTVTKTSSYYLFQNRKKKKVKISLNDRKKVAILLGKIQNGKPYLVQRSVAFTKENKNIDFRVIMQKDTSQKWKCSGIIARYGRTGNIYTNDTSKIMSGSEALKLTFSLNKKEIIRKLNEVVSISTTVCKTIELFYGNYGDFGIDLIIDENLHIWIIEVNVLHIHSIAYYLTDQLQMYQKVVTRPLEYAKSLTIFHQR